MPSATREATDTSFSSSSSSSSASSDNSLTEYLRILQRTKNTLPYRQLICISASPSISTMAALLRLARAVGPFIAVLQVHADIIDDWSPESVAELTYVASVHGFLIWEGGRVLNTARRHQIASPRETQRYLDMARKRYTKGLVSVASWAGLASTWLVEPGKSNRQSNSFNDLLAPTLKKAARETVNSMPGGITTKISVGMSANDEEQFPDTDVDENERDGARRSWSVSSLTDGVGSEGGEEGEKEENNERQASAISFTRTITQHTEVSRSPDDATDTQGTNGMIVSRHTYTASDHSIKSSLSSSQNEFPPPPSTARGIIVCAPEQSTKEYSEACTSVATEHSDFVVGFVTQKPWVEVSRWEDFMPAKSKPPTSGSDSDADADADVGEYGSKNKKTFALFAPLESEQVLPPTNEECTLEDSDSDEAVGYGSGRTLELSFDPQSPSSSHDTEIRTLHQVIAKALAVREEKAQARRTGSGESSLDSDESEVEVQYIPIISMNA